MSCAILLLAKYICTFDSMGVDRRDCKRCLPADFATAGIFLNLAFIRNRKKQPFQFFANADEGAICWR